MKTKNIVLAFLLTGLIVTFGCTKVNTDEILYAKDTPETDFSNIENLYEQPLEVIQKCVQGNWKLQYSSLQYLPVGITPYPKITNPYGYYMYLTPNHIIAGNDSLGNSTNSPIIWIKEENFLGSGKNPYLLTYNHYTEITEQDGIIYEEHQVANYLLFLAIRNDTLLVWNCLIDGYIDYYTKIEE
jgi:hypothetical protein